MLWRWPTSVAVLRKGYDINAGILEEDHNKYFDNLDKYAAGMEELIIWFTNKYNVKLKSAVAEFNRLKKG